MFQTTLNSLSKKLPSFEKNPFSRISVLLLIGGFICSLVLLIFFYVRWEEYERIEHKISQLEYKRQIREKGERKKQKFFSQIERGNRLFVQKNLESFIPLSAERKELETLAASTLGDFALQNRLNFLNSSSNQFHFEETKSTRNDNIEEIDLHQLHPVEIDLSDLKRILSLVEGVTIGSFGPKKDRPQLIIKDFSLEKKEKSSTYILEMDLVQRGALSQ